MKTLTIFEGPNGSGKSHLADRVSQLRNTEFFHHGPYPEWTTDDLIIGYIDSMLPALTGKRDVVLDRCWISEQPYGLAYRGGKDRLGALGRDVLWTLASKLSLVTVVCLPPWETVQENCAKRETKPGLALHDDGIATTYAWYKAWRNVRPPWPGYVIEFDYTRGNVREILTYLEGVRQ